MSKKGIFFSYLENHSFHTSFQTSISKAPKTFPTWSFFLTVENPFFFPLPLKHPSTSEKTQPLMKCTWQHLQRSPEAWAGICSKEQTTAKLAQTPADIPAHQLSFLPSPEVTSLWKATMLDLTRGKRILYMFFEFRFKLYPILWTLFLL